jgi:hypothetical protein
MHGKASCTYEMSTEPCGLGALEVGLSPKEQTTPETHVDGLRYHVTPDPLAHYLILSIHHMRAWPIMI